MRLPFARRSRKSGSVMVLFTLMLPAVLIPLVGLAIDASVARLVQIRLQAAVDGAALGAGRLLGATAGIEDIAGEFLKANFRTDNSAGTWGAFNLQSTRTFTNGLTKRIDINATAQVPLLFLRVFGYTNTTVAANGSATRSDSRVIFVLDRSGSMDTAGSSVIANARDQAEAFVRRFTPAVDELGLVVFDGSAVVGYPTYTAGNWTSAVTSLSTAGPKTNFIDPTHPNNDLPTQIQAVTADSGTGMAEALSIAYIELQKAHMRDFRVEAKPDTRLNSIVLLTDGVPTAISMYLNNPTNSNANNIVTAGSGCANKIIPAPTVAKPVPENANTMMKAWFAVGGGPVFSNNTFASSGNPLGMEKLASMDTANSSNWWMSNGASTTAQDVAKPYSTTSPEPFDGCTQMMNVSNSNATYSRFSRIPDVDMWGNALTGTGYTNSHVSGAGAVTSVYTHGNLDQSKEDVPYHWGLAMWNSVDNAARRIRRDSDYAKRQAIGDTSQKMSIGIYVVGYTGNGGVDDGLLMRVANDTRAAGYVPPPTEPNGRYYSASSAAQMADALNKVASDLLRLAR